MIAGREVDAEQLALLEESGKDLVVEAIKDTQFVVAMTEPWPHSVIQHYGQIHTNQAALAEGAKHIRLLGQQLYESGRASMEKQRIQALNLAESLWCIWLLAKYRDALSADRD